MNPEYRLDFLIPKGPTGPTGPAGILALLYTDYNNISDSGNLTIRRNSIVPGNANIFSINNNEITMQENGYYEIILTGCFKETNRASNNPYIAVKIETNGTTEDFMVITLQNTSEIYFSQTKILRTENSKILKISFYKEQNSNASIENINLIIKKFPY